MKEEIQLTILGDICPDREFNRFFRNTNELDLGDVGTYLQTRDVVVANLEAPASPLGAKQKKTGPCLHCQREDLDGMKQQGIQILSLANNHILDYGPEALLDTIASAEACGLQTFGAGKNREEASRELIIEKNGWKIGFLSFAEHEFNIAYEDSPGANLFDPYESYDQISKVRGLCDYLIILYHGGIEHYKYPSALLQKKCRKMISSGADIVLCQHSHCIGTLETFEKGTILYGQGNAYFGMREGNTPWNTGLLVDICLSEEKRHVSFRMIEAGKTGISFAQKQESEERIAQMLSDSEKIGDAAFLKSQWDGFCAKEEPMVLSNLYGWNRYFNKLNRLLKNRLAKVFIGKRARMVTMNLVRCDSHREVVQTILENSGGFRGR